MKDFARLFAKIDDTNKTNEKVNALVEYFSYAADQDKLWTIALFTGRNPKKIVKTNELKQWAAEMAGIPYWLFEESYHVAGDLSETISNILPDFPSSENTGLAGWIHKMLSYEHASAQQKKELITNAWKQFSREERFVFNKLGSGTFRVGISAKLMMRALARHTGIDENIIAHRLMGDWSPLKTTFHELLFAENFSDQRSTPYPFYLAYALETGPDKLGDKDSWLAEYKWDGIRSQFIYRNGEVYIWSRGEELITDRFPDLHAISSLMPDDVVIDGELIGYKNGQVLGFNELQKRIGRKNITAKILNDVPVCIYAYDILEFNGKDIRQMPLIDRRAILEGVVMQVASSKLMLSPVIPYDNWDDLARIRSEAREMNSEGLMLKKADSVYEVGRKKGNWWKWKLDPMSVDAVMIYAMRGHGRRANLYTDYTFAVWDDEGKLVPFTKAYSGLTDQEIFEVDAWVKKNTTDKFGPVRSVTAEQVFEIGFEGITYSSRHKSGVALRFPRILRWRKDKKASEADTLASVKKLIT